jgi:hypothetical protein
LSKLRFSIIRYTTRSIGHRVSSSDTGVPKVGRGDGEVDTLDPKQDERNSPDAAAADRVMN